jgi:hypothetical protein
MAALACRGSAATAWRCSGCDVSWQCSSSCCCCSCCSHESAGAGEPELP